MGPPRDVGSRPSLLHDLGKSLPLQESLFPNLRNRNNTDLLYELRSADKRAGTPKC